MIKRKKVKKERERIQSNEKSCHCLYKVIEDLLSPIETFRWTHSWKLYCVPTSYHTHSCYNLTAKTCEITTIIMIINFCYSWLYSSFSTHFCWIFNRCEAFSRGLSGGSDSKESPCNTRGLALIPWWGRSPGEGNGFWLLTPGLSITRDLLAP